MLCGFETFILMIYTLQHQAGRLQGFTWRAQLILTAPCSRRLPLATHLPLSVWSTSVNLWKALTTRPSLVFTTPCGLSLSPAAWSKSSWDCCKKDGIGRGAVAQSFLKTFQYICQSYACAKGRREADGCFLLHAWKKSFAEMHELCLSPQSHSQHHQREQ